VGQGHYRHGKQGDEYLGDSSRKKRRLGGGDVESSMVGQGGMESPIEVKAKRRYPLEKGGGKNRCPTGILS